MSDDKQKCAACKQEKPIAEFTVDPPWHNLYSVVKRCATCREKINAEQREKRARRKSLLAS